MALPRPSTFSIVAFDPKTKDLGVAVESRFVSFGAVYFLVPRLWKREGLYSLKLVSYHYWIATVGILLYITSMWVAGIMQGLMWRSYDELGFLQYSFIEAVAAMHPFYIIRTGGGVLFLLGSLIMVYNLWKTVQVGPAEIAQPTRPLAGARA